MSETNDSTGAAEPMDEETPEPSPALGEEILGDPARLMGLIQQRPELLQHLAAGYRAAREGFSDFLTANDRGADRVKDTADTVLDSIQRDLDREGLEPEERDRLFDREERILGEVRGNEREVREANERSFARLATLGVSVAVGVVTLGYLVKQGKLPPSLPSA